MNIKYEIQYNSFFKLIISIHKEVSKPLWNEQILLWKDHVMAHSVTSQVVSIKPQINLPLICHYYGPFIHVSNSPCLGNKPIIAPFSSKLNSLSWIITEVQQSWQTVYIQSIFPVINANYLHAMCGKTDGAERAQPFLMWRAFRPNGPTSHSTAEYCGTKKTKNVTVARQQAVKGGKTSRRQNDLSIQG